MGIGYEDSVSPYWSHALQLWFLRQLPEWINIQIGLTMHLPIRKAGLKKEARRLEEANKSLIWQGAAGYWPRAFSEHTVVRMKVRRPRSFQKRLRVWQTHVARSFAS